MKTDAEVLSGAIEILEQEGMWCQHAYYRTDSTFTKKLSFCAEGAIREVAGYWELVNGVAVDGEEKPTIINDAYFWSSFPVLHLVAKQCKRVERLVLQQTAGCQPPVGFLNGFNDDEHTTVADVLLAMKKALNEVENAEGGDVHP